MSAWLLCLAIDAQNTDVAKQRPQGQRREFNPELYQKRMKDFVAKEAKLTEAEQAKFFPILNEMLDKQHKLMKTQRELLKKGWTREPLSESDYEDLVTKATSNDVEMKKIEQTYYKKFHSVLSWQKIYAVRQALARFQMEALRHFQPGGNAQHGKFQKGNSNQNQKDNSGKFQKEK